MVPETPSVPPPSQGTALTIIVDLHALRSFPPTTRLVEDVVAKNLESCMSERSALDAPNEPFRLIAQCKLPHVLGHPENSSHEDYEPQTQYHHHVVSRLSSKRWGIYDPMLTGAVGHQLETDRTTRQYRFFSDGVWDFAMNYPSLRLRKTYRVHLDKGRRRDQTTADILSSTCP